MRGRGKEREKSGGWRKDERRRGPRGEKMKEGGEKRDTCI